MATILIASPQLEDPFFGKTVVLVWHHDEDGAMGVVLSKTLDHTLAEVLTLDEPLDLEPYEHNELHWGGPVAPTSGTVISQIPVSEREGWNLESGVSVTRSLDAMISLIRRGEPFKLCLGYAGWGPGQLDAELEDGNWLFTDCSVDLILECPPEELYERALATLGLSAEGTLWFPTIES